MPWNRKWDRHNIIQAIHERRRQGKPINSQAVRKDNLPLWMAAVTHIGSWRRALAAANVDVDEVSIRRRWTRERVIQEIKRRRSDGQPLNPGSVQSDDPGFWGASKRIFGSWSRALRAAGIDPTEVYVRRPKGRTTTHATE